MCLCYPPFQETAAGGTEAADGVCSRCDFLLWEEGSVQCGVHQSWRPPISAETFNIDRSDIWNYCSHILSCHGNDRN